MSTPVTLEEAISSYQAKTALLVERLGEPVTYYQFYRTMYPQGFLQDAYKVNESAKRNGKFIAIANVQKWSEETPTRPSKKYRRNVYIPDDLSPLRKLLQHVCFMSPCSFLGGKKDLEHLRYVHALVVDLDYVQVDNLRDLLHQIKIGFLPEPTFIVNSGTGLHLYFVFSEPQQVLPSQQPAFKSLKYLLIDHCWNGYTSSKIERQYSGLVQPYRIPGSRTKLDCGEDERVISQEYPVTAFRCGKTWTVDELLAFRTYDGSGIWNRRVEEVADEFAGRRDDPDKITLEKAKKLWPEWYAERIEKQQPVRSVEEYAWQAPEHVYTRWLERIREEAFDGNRYWCIHTLAVYALKCGIPYARLKKDAYSLLDVYEQKTESELNHFLASDIEQALKVYFNKGYIKYPNSAVRWHTKLSITPNKRNGKKQSTHLKIARATQAIMDEERGTNWRNGNGRKTKKQLILDYAAKHPEANHSQIASALNVSRPTVIKWLKIIPEE